MNFVQKYLGITAYLKIAITVTEQSTMISAGNKAWLSAPQCIINRDVVTSISNEAKELYFESNYANQVQPAFLFFVLLYDEPLCL